MTDPNTQVFTWNWAQNRSRGTTIWDNSSPQVNEWLPRPLLLVNNSYSAKAKPVNFNACSINSNTDKKRVKSGARHLERIALILKRTYTTHLCSVWRKEGCMSNLLTEVTVTILYFLFILALLKQIKCVLWGLTDEDCLNKCNFVHTFF